MITGAASGIGQWVHWAVYNLLPTLDGLPKRRLSFFPLVVQQRRINRA
jgi:hypothetical protein